jgi:cation diffusion facilitator CzcD-associated flavoprotein CzcO
MDQLLPSFPPACRRSTPGPGYLEALTTQNVDVIFEPIAKIATDGVITSDGAHRPVDAIACATGFDTTFVGRFPIAGKNNVLLSEKWKVVPATYMSLATLPEQ